VPFGGATLLVAVRINGQGREVLYLAKGDSVKLGCPYVLEPEDAGPQGVGIEWIQITPERPGPENVFLSYQDHHVNYGSSGLQDRVAFVQTDPGQRDASIRVADLQESDTGTYQCRVKKNTVAVHEVIVTVQGERPAAPQCWSEGALTEGGSVLLRCFSRGGAAPLNYQWAKVGLGVFLPAGTLQGGYGPPRGAQRGFGGSLSVGRAPGDLVIRSLTVAHAGTYQCRVSNRVGYSVCQLRMAPGVPGWHGGCPWGVPGLQSGSGVALGSHWGGTVVSLGSRLALGCPWVALGCPWVAPRCPWAPGWHWGGTGVSLGGTAVSLGSRLALGWHRVALGCPWVALQCP
uniref:Ig-like domain-containing protein n=1 Tax=Taeniopygia guttata TaxID=59729 RepID=A0A674GQV5_TAEGU